MRTKNGPKSKLDGVREGRPLRTPEHVGRSGEISRRPVPDRDAFYLSIPLRIP
jgi:hypothetical protein